MKFDISTRQFIESETDPHKTAVVGTDHALSWRELEEISGQLRSLLAAMTIPKGHPVLIYGHKESHFIAAIVAAIQCELPYVPIDSSTPLARLGQIAQLIGAGILIDCTQQFPAADFSFLHVIRMGDLRDQGLPSPCSYPVLPAWDPENPIVYVIFTSGSTGGPKGVQISRRALASFVEWIENDFTWHSQDVFLNQAAFSFDLSVYEIMALLRLGGSLVLTGMELARDSRKLIQHLETQACTVWVSTPSFASVMLADRQFSEATLPKLRQFVFCGERLPVALVKELHRRFPRAQVLNTYGPTEATVATTMVEITPEMTELYAQALPVGYPKRNSRIEIHPHPDSSNAIEGEIVIIGDHVASGYFAQPELNAQKFFQIPQAGRETSAFRTGDIGFMRDGLLFFIGRRDHQIKFHGYRIDLAEVDEEILKVDGVSEALTLPLERDGKVMKLLSFVSLRPSMGDLALTPESLRGWLQKKLPAYMVPSEIRFLDALPHNQNHKIDRQKLLELALMKDVRRSA